MNAFSIVIGLNILKDVHLSLFVIAIFGILNKLSFQSVVEGFRDGIVTGVPLAAHTLNATVTP